MHNLSAACDEVSYGLRFKGSEYMVADRTSYDMFDGYRHVRGGGFSLEFDIDITSPEEFGYVLNLGDGEAEFNIVLVNFRDKSNVYLDFNAIATHAKLSAPIAITECREDAWHKVALRFDFVSDKIVFTVDGLEQSVDYDFGDFKRLLCIFGRSAKYTDVPLIILRNVSYTDARGTVSCPLNQHEGTSVADCAGNQVGSVANPCWEFDSHHFWNKIESLSQRRISALAYDTARHNLVIYNADSIFVWNMGRPSGWLRRVNSHADAFDIDSGGMIYDDRSDRMLICNPLPQLDDRYSIAAFDYIGDDYHPEDLALASSRLNHHNAVVDYSAGVRDLWIFGGYGNHSYSNRLCRYSASVHRWQAEHFEGDEIEPRFFAGMGRVSDGIYYLFGGFGNHSGSQADGADNMYDLYKVDFSHRKIEYLTDFTNSGEAFVPAENLIVADDGASFYAFCYNHNEARPKGYIKRFDIVSGAVTTVSDGIDLISEKIETKVLLWYDTYYKKILCAVHDYKNETEVDIQLYTLAFPPLPLDKTDNAPTKGANLWVIMVVVAVVIVAAMAAFVLLRRRKKFRAETATVSVAVPAVDGDISPNRIYIMGDFLVRDNSGCDISYRFSTKLRQLFILLLVNSDAPNDGISSDEISATLWPEKGDSSNIRRVTIKNLRDVLTDIDGVELLSQNSKWVLSITAPCICDYLYIMSQTLEQVKAHAVETDYVQSLTAMFMRGTLAHVCNYHWLDACKLRFEEHSIEILTTLLDRAVAVGNNPQTLRLTSCLLILDPLNEDVFKTELRALKRMGRQPQAELKFHLFAEEYRKSYGRELSAKDFL